MSFADSGGFGAARQSIIYGINYRKDPGRRDNYAYITKSICAAWYTVLRMNRKEMFSVSDFAKYARTTRDTLIYYDKIGLLSPVSRGDNNYRFYSHRQLSIINLIRTMQILGMPLNDIKRLKNNRTPELVDTGLERQIKMLDSEIDDLVRVRELLHSLKNTIHSHLDVDETVIKVQLLPEEKIVLGEQNDYSGGRNAYDALFSFYSRCNEEYPALDLNYPVWGLFSEERIHKRDWVWPDHYYFYNPAGNDKRPAALYAIGYTRGGYGQGHDLYVRLIDYINANGFEICGPAYEEYPLNEICVLEEKDYLMRIMITVKRK